MNGASRLLLLLSLYLSLRFPTCVSAQTTALEIKSDLAAVLQPVTPFADVPHRFVLVLTNTGESTLRLPMPYVGCTAPTASGSLALDESWQPVSGPGLATGSGSCCSGGVSPAPSLLEQAQSWYVLGPRESMTIPLTASLFGEGQPGTYTFSATYLAPELTKEAMQTLRTAGISVPRGQVTSGTLVYRK